MYGQKFEIRGRDFSNAGKASAQIKSVLKELGIESSAVRRVAICSYEAEMNVVMYAQKAVMSFSVTPDRVDVRIKDKGPGIPDIEMAMKEGFTTATEEMREMGFGAGMGLPNMRRNADKFKIESVVGEGTDVQMTIYYAPTAAV